MVEALVELAEQQLPEIVATLDRGEMPKENWKAAVNELMAEAQARIPQQVSSSL